MKIGIMTFWWADENYGQILQCYALQKYLRNMGHDAYLIRYDSRNDYIRTPVWKRLLHACNPKILYNYFRFRKQTYNNKKEKENDPRYFDAFRKNFIMQSEKIYYYYKELVSNPPEADIYIVGSDQVWNNFSRSFESTKARLKAYLLDFGNSKIKRIAYAASFGKEKVDNAVIKEMSPLLKKFAFVSVREKSGLDICRQCGIDNAEWVVDPTMLLSKEEYRSLYDMNSIIKQIKKPYCFLYILGNEYDFSLKTVYAWANKKNLDIIYVSGTFQHDRYKKHFASIPEWIFLIDNAEYVITNSYHGSVFALLFQKKFGVIPLTGKDSGMNTRLDCLFELFNLSARFVHDDLSIVDIEINWDIVSSVFTHNKEICKLANIIG
jgi:hypothetical protein